MNKEDVIKILKSKKDLYHLKNFILFGSVAIGTNTNESDIDIAYIEDDKFRLNFDSYIKLENEEKFYCANKQLNFNATVNISAMRDKISHNYRGIDESMVWEIIKDYLPVLKELLVEMLPKICDSKLYIKEALKTQYYEELYYLNNLNK